MTAIFHPNLHVVRFAPAKLNLTLAVLGRRGDGYHSLHSVMVPLSLGDALTVSAAAAGAAHDTLRVSGLAVSAESDNLILRALAATRGRLAASHAPAVPPTPFLAVRLAKRIPVAAGLGGGSSDAAAAMAAALAAWGAALDPVSGLAVAASLGSDVPFFLSGGSALVTGRGENVEPLADLTGDPVAVLLVTPRLSLSTRDVFRVYAASGQGNRDSSARLTSERLAESMRRGMSGRELLARAPDLAEANDLMAPAMSVAAGLRGFRDGLARLLDRPVGQSGSGPTLWALYPSLAEARKMIRAVRTAAVNGTIPPLGQGEPFVTATLVTGRPSDVTATPSDRGALADRTLTVHNGHLDEPRKRPGAAGAEAADDRWEK